MRGSGIFHAVFLYPAAPDTRGRACPLRALAPRVQPMPLPAQPRGCKGRSPLHKKSSKSPPSRREGGGGDGGRKSSYRQGRQATKTTAPPHKATRRQGRQATNKARHPTRQRGDRVGRRQTRRAPLRAPPTPEQQKSRKGRDPPCPPADKSTVDSQQPTINTYSLSRFPSWSAERHTDPNLPSRAPCRAHRARQTESPPHGRQDR